MTFLASFRRLLSRWQFPLLGFLTLWLLYGLTLNVDNLTEFSLQQMGVEAIVERGVFYVDGSRTPQLEPGGDVFQLGKHLYAAKQPGQFMAGALIYFFLFRLGLSYLSNFLLTSALVTWFTSGLITALSTVVLFYIARTLARANSTLWALGAAAAFALATIAFPYAGVAHHDAIAAAYLLIAFGAVLHLALRVTGRDMWLAGLAGALLGLTITTSILPLFMALMVGLYFLTLRRWTLCPAFGVGVLVGLLPLFIYDTINFGNPFLLPNVAGNFSDTYFELDADNFSSKVTFYARQLTLYAPLVWLGLVGLFLLPGKYRREQLIMFGMIAVLLGYVLNIDTDGDCQFGPRYLLPAMPYVALGVVGFSYLAMRALRTAAVVALGLIGLVSFGINTMGALYGVMYCHLNVYALTPYLESVQQGQFHVLPLLPVLLPWFALVVAGWLILLNVRLIRLQQAGDEQRTWFTRAAALVLGIPALTLITLWTAAFLRFYRLWDLPPGLWIDEAFYGLDALRVLRTGYLSAFFAQNGGREPLFIYMQSGALALLGVEDWALRIVPALVGILTVAIMIPLGRTLFQDTPRARYIGLAAAAALAVLYWHVNFSRLGFRAILLPAASSVTIWLFWRGWQNRSRRDLILSGVALGITLYTYLSARFLPFILIGFAAVVLVLYVLNRRASSPPPSNINAPQSDWKFTIGAVALVLLAAAVVALPLGLYFYQHPDDLFGRTAAVALTPENIELMGLPPDTPPALIIGDNLFKIARIFIDYGDTNLRHNLPGRAALDPLLALGFFVGLVAGILSLRRSPVYALLFIWILVMVVPSIFSIEAPHFLRMIGALPPIILLVADGLTRVWERVAPRLGWNSLLILILLVSGSLTFRDYFLTWANLPALQTEGFDTASTGLGTQLKAASYEADILLPVRLYGRAGLQFALAEDFDTVENWDPALPLDRPLVFATREGAGDKQLVLLRRDEQGRGKVYFTHVIPGLSNMRSGEPQPILTDEGTRVGNIFPLPDEVKALIRPPSSTKQISVQFANGLELVGFDVNPPDVKPDGTVELALYWKPQTDLDRDYTVFVHLVDKDGAVHAQMDGQPMFGFYTMGLWHSGGTITDLYPLHIPADAEPGTYKFQVGLVGFNGERLSILDADGNVSADSETFGRLQVAP